MEDTISNTTFKKLNDFLDNHFGVNNTISQDKNLTNSIKKIAIKHNYLDIDEFVEKLITNQLNSAAYNDLVNNLTIGETYFLREKKGLQYLTEVYIPKLIEERSKGSKQIKIWSAGCATGEEPYTIAILLHRLIPDLINWDISILATDINEDFISKAKKGVYTNWSFRNNPDWLTENYFHKIKDNKYQISSFIQKMVTFKQLNLADGDYPSDYTKTTSIDIILCRNVLIYFANKTINQVTQRFFQSLKSKGILLVSPVEMNQSIYQYFNKMLYQGLTIYQKGSQPETNNYTHLLSKRTKKNKSQITDSNCNINAQYSIKPKDTSGNLDYAYAYELYKNRKYDEAEKVLSNLKIEQCENPKVIMVLLAKTKANLGKLNEAKLTCNEALKFNSTDDTIYFLNATILHEQGRDDEAIISLRKALYLNQNFVLAHFLLGNIAFKNKQFKKGKKHFKNVQSLLSKLNPKDIIKESEGITAEKFSELITQMQY